MNLWNLLWIIPLIILVVGVMGLMIYELIKHWNDKDGGAGFL